jgi:DNA-binding YbaB/EbfC family protein
MKGGFQKMILDQMQRLQADMGKAQEALAGERVEATAGGGMVKAVVTGMGELLEVTISRDVVDPEDVEMLQDLVLAAVKEALAKAKELQAERMGGLTGGLQIPGLL